MINGVVMFCLAMDSFTTGLIVSENAGEVTKVMMVITALFFNLTFNIALLEFCRQMVNNITGEDCLDADHGEYISTLARELRMHFKYGLPSDANPAEEDA